MIDFKALKGDSTDNIPGVPGVGDKTAAKLVQPVRQPRCAVRAPRRGDAGEAPREAPRAPRPGARQPRARHDPPRPAGDARPRCGPLRRLRPRRGRPALPRVRVPDADRAAPAAARASGAQDASRSSRRSPGGAGSGGAGHGTDPGAQARNRGPAAVRQPGRPRRGGPPAGQRRRPAARARLRLRRARSAQAARSDPARTRRRCPAGDLRASACAAPRRAGPGRARRRAGIPALAEWLAGRSAVGAALILDDPRPRQGTRARARRSPARMAGSSSRTARLRRTRCAGPWRAARVPARRPRGRSRSWSPAAPRTRPRSRTAGRVRHADRRLPAQRVAPQPGDRRRRRRAARPGAAAGGRGPRPARAGRARGACRARRPRRRSRPRSREAALDRLFARAGAAADPDPRPDGGDRASRSTATRLASWTWSSPASSARLEAEIYADVGHEFTLGSPKQLEQVLFYELNLPKGQAHEDRLLDRRDRCSRISGRPIRRSAKLLDWRLYSKLRSTYVDGPAGAARGRRPAPHDVPPGRGRDRAALARPTRTSRTSRSGRRSAAGSGGPSWPARPDVTLVAADYSQIELRILAHVSGDAHLRDAFAGRRRHPPRDGGPGAPQGARRHHARRALDGQDGQLRDRLRDERLRAVEPGEHPARRGAGVHRAATSRRTRGISYYMLHIKETARQQGYVTTLLGRRRAIPELRATQPDRCARQASGWPSTCRSRGRPPTS